MQRSRSPNYLALHSVVARGISQGRRHASPTTATPTNVLDYRTERAEHELHRLRAPTHGQRRASHGRVYGDDRVFLILKQDREDERTNPSRCRWPQFDRGEETRLLAGLNIYTRDPNNK